MTQLTWPTLLAVLNGGLSNQGQLKATRLSYRGQGQMSGSLPLFEHTDWGENSY